ncbi:MAG TPA: anaerobic ribonucleoside-triphosphate reductase activating protein [Candidatus Portnoybacteria bacterium]|uniref:Anaerobic ribonucleoside-triphosphate reductase activating protein n=1 Tax=Candidatus Portnoybacteria bacterium CG02_land_8_20_14_3_00_45_8 TaxID=1974807 RepID=A0A2M7D5V5_9BACT|nr:MAG: anaerobic ribonucleoside-triphosphate reductase activating protein [Candidatus Portnoybacteria bacterium CG02_land_8_20_14_3_00_45_8]HCX28006.1 anaerobic ribonucleoside-triphosphate reductase activating protein [Candidatus Portnoybacteria bacterium]
MTFGGLQKLTLIDYPGKVAATIFTVGCNFLCPYCHNPELVDPIKIKDQPKLSEKEILKFLTSRQGLLEGVCITGGEPTLSAELPEFISKIKALGFLIKLDTNGSSPEMLARLLSERLVDYVAMDIKAPLEKYKKIVGGQASLEDIQRSVELTRSAPDYEFRTTVLPVLHSPKDILSIGRWLQGAKKYYLQQFQPTKTLDSAYLDEKPFAWDKLAELRSLLEIFFDKCEIRE